MSKNHAIKRAMQRFSLKLNENDLSKIIRAIQSQRSALISRITKYRRIHAVNVNGVITYVVYSNNNKPIVRTFLSSGMAIKTSGLSSAEIEKRIKPIRDEGSMVRTNHYRLTQQR